MRASTPDAPDPRAVFLNVPYDPGYQPLFVTLVTTLVCLGQKPRCVCEITERGQGRLDRIFSLLRSCRVSLHDLSRVGLPARLNMPFELGLACAFSLSGGNHEVVVLDTVPYRLDRTLSDYKGRDPLIHHGRCDDLVGCVLDLYAVADEPSPEALRRAAKLLRRSALEICRQYGPSIFRAAPYRALVEAATEHALERGFISP